MPPWLPTIPPSAPDKAPAAQAERRPQWTRRIHPVSSETPAIATTSEYAARDPHVNERADKPTDCARHAEAEQHVTVDVLP